ncbi:NEAT domain-containing protein [Sporosarcina luteola]|uniref:NEAT domain-containing protein n=1 Tax=Sporosarcina luteola TaxID=582850 RepID=UPI00204203BB|nr:NEAT domain-containing protein [Sporosarcina luteola]MCM3709051.1 NEAT domain-containing protein [Sporosarcina luteola]
MKRNLIVAMSIALVAALFLPVMPLKAEAATFADGEYSVPFTVLKDTGNEVSTTADYMVSPAKVQMVNDKATVTVTLKNSSWWQYFKVQNGGSYSDVQVVSQSGDQRVVRFTVSDLKQLVNAKIHIIVTGIPGFDYDNKYDIRFNFNTSSIPAPPVAKPAATPPPAKETKPVTPKKTEVKPVQKTEQKPVQKPVANKTEAAKTTESVTKKDEKLTVIETETDKTEQSGTKSEEAKTEEDETAIEDELSEEADTDVALDENDEAAEEVVEEVAMEEVKDEKEKTSNTFLIVIIVIGAIIGAAVVVALARKRARK